jgi:hypothetical protein
MEIANQVAANNKAGLAALRLIEELSDTLSPESMFEAYGRANNWLSDLQNHEVQVRLNLAARKMLAEKLEPSKARPEMTNGKCKMVNRLPQTFARN